MPSITVYVKDLASTRALVGSGPITSAYDVTYDDPLSAVGAFSFKVPCRDPKATLLQTQLRSVDIYADDDLAFVGIIETKTRVIGAQGAYFQVTGYSLARELADESVLFLTLASGSAGVTNGPSTILAEHSKSWSLDTTNGNSVTTATYYGRFLGPSVLAALTKLQERSGEHWIYRPGLSGADRKIIWIGAAGTASGLRAIGGAGEAVALEGNAHAALITNLEVLEDGAELYNRVYLYGAGQDLENSALTIAATTVTSDSTYTVSTASNYVQYAPSGYGYRVREQVLQFEDIAPVSNTAADVQAAANMLVYAGQVWLDRNATLPTFYRLTVTKLPADLQPGQTIRTIYYEENFTTGDVVHDIDANLIVLNIETTYTSGGAFHVLTVANVDRWPETDEVDIANRLAKAQVYQNHTQIGPAVYTFSYDEDFDDTTAAELPFWLGAEIAQVQQVLLRFAVEPLHSTVQSVGGTSTTTGSGGGETVSSAGGGATSTTSGAGGGTTATSADSGSYAGVTGAELADHTHTETGGTTSIQSANHSHNFTIPLHSHSVTLSDHSHSITLGDHTHSVTTNNHTHSVTAAISAVYGIYTESDSGKIIRTDSTANLEADMTLTVNGGAYSGAIARTVVGGDDWFELDLTDDLINATTFRPSQTVNTIAAIADTGKTGRIKAQLLVRASVQAVANL